MKWLDTNPRPVVTETEFKRLLGYPPDYPLTDRAAELNAWVRQWYAEHGRPWIYARELEKATWDDAGVVVEGVPLRSAELRNRLSRAQADGAVVVAAGAGAEAETQAMRLWKDEKPDEYFFLESYASAVVEALVVAAGARLCAWADERRRAALPHYSPGYTGWDLADQSALMDLVRHDGTDPLPESVEVLSSGMLRPKKTQLALFGLTSRVDLTERFDGLVPCTRCNWSPCAYRRAPFAGGADSSRHARPAGIDAAMELLEQVGGIALARIETAPALRADVKYAVAPRVLQRWSGQRLVLEPAADGGWQARFRFDGTTCSNMGQPLAFDYCVRIAPAREAYRIVETACRAVADVPNEYAAMCAYIEDSDRLIGSLADEHPMLGQPLDEVVDWSPNVSQAGCLCDRASRDHKWRLAFHTIHYALAQRLAKQAG